MSRRSTSIPALAPLSARAASRAEPGPSFPAEIGASAGLHVCVTVGRGASLGTSSTFNPAFVSVSSSAVPRSKRNPSTKTKTTPAATSTAGDAVYFPPLAWVQHPLGTPEQSREPKGDKAHQPMQRVRLDLLSREADSSACMLAASTFHPASEYPAIRASTSLTGIEACGSFPPSGSDAQARIRGVPGQVPPKPSPDDPDAHPKVTRRSRVPRQANSRAVC